MGKKKHPEHVNHERWLVSYADFITLLFAFFVVLFASGQSDKKKQQKFATAFQQAFSQMAIFEPHARKPPLTDAALGSSSNADPMPIQLPMGSAGAGDAQKRTKQIAGDMAQFVETLAKEQARKGHMGKADLATRNVADGTALSLREGSFFASGSAELRSAAFDTLDAIAAQVGPGVSLRIEGHTDNQPIHSAEFRSNWELSSARASAIAHYLLEHSRLNPSQLAVAGYAEFHPIASNATEEGRGKNRRVDIVFLSNPTASETQAH